MLPLQWFYTLVNAHLCVLKLEAFISYELDTIVTSMSASIVGKIPSLCTAVHSNAVCYNSEHSNILHGLTWRHKFVYVSPVNLSRFRLGQFTTTRDILKQHICTLTRLLILILLLIAGIEANPGPNTPLNKEIIQYLKLNEFQEKAEELYESLENFHKNINIDTMKDNHNDILKDISECKWDKDIVEYSNKVIPVIQPKKMK